MHKLVRQYFAKLRGYVNPVDLGLFQQRQYLLLLKQPSTIHYCLQSVTAAMNQRQVPNLTFKMQDIRTYFTPKYDTGKEVDEKDTTNSVTNFDIIWCGLNLTLSLSIYTSNITSALTKHL